MRSHLRRTGGTGSARWWRSADGATVTATFTQSIKRDVRASAAAVTAADRGPAWE